MARIHKAPARTQARPTLSWVPVTGPDGRTRMEMRWRVASRHGANRTSEAA